MTLPRRITSSLISFLNENPRSFLTDRNAKVTEITPAGGIEVTGLNILDLSDTERDQLALEVARKGIIVFRDQEKWFDASPEEWKEFGNYFGPLHVQPTSGHPKGLPELRVVYRAPGYKHTFQMPNQLRTNPWHGDVTYELQPTGLTSFFLVDQPSTGGDTVFCLTTAAFRRFSPPFQAFLRTLSAVHSGIAQAAYGRSAQQGGVLRREPVENIHPVVRKHPVTGEEALFVNWQLTTHIVGLKKEESDNLLNFLNDEVAKAIDVQIRVKWQPNTVVIWDNRTMVHSAIVDYTDYINKGERRHGVRLASRAERPIPATGPVQA